jgi:DDE family transposase
VSKASWTGHEPAWTRSASGRKGGALTGPNPTDRSKGGSQYHLLVDAHGLPLNVLVSGANRHDSLFVEPILDGMPAIKRGGRGRPRRRPVKLHGDKGYDNPRCAVTCAAAGSPPASPAEGGSRAPCIARDVTPSRLPSSRRL